MGDNFISYQSEALGERVSIQKYQKGDTYVVIMAMSFTLLGGKINMNAVTPQRLGNFSMNRISPDTALEEIAKYEEDFLTNIQLRKRGVAPRVGVTKPSLRESFVRFDEQDQLKTLQEKIQGIQTFLLVYDR